MITLLTLWAYIRYTIIPSLYTWLSKIPAKVWYIIAAILMVLYYGSWKERQGYKACTIAVQIAQQKEKDRQQRVVDSVINNSIAQALEAKKKSDLLEGQVQDAMDKIKKLETASSVCLPSPITDSLRRIGGSKSGR